MLQLRKVSLLSRLLYLSIDLLWRLSSSRVASTVAMLSALELCGAEEGDEAEGAMSKAWATDGE